MADRHVVCAGHDCEPYISGCTGMVRDDGTRYYRCRNDDCSGQGRACGGYCSKCFDHVMRWSSIRGLSFDTLSKVNRERCKRWHDPDSEPWSGADWSNAMCGEAGEAANVVKKLRRHETGTAPEGDPSEVELRAMLADEIADVICYLDLLADHYEIDVPLAVVEKFNRVSERQGFPERLEDSRERHRRSV